MYLTPLTVQFWFYDKGRLLQNVGKIFVDINIKSWLSKHELNGVANS